MRNYFMMNDRVRFIGNLNVFGKRGIGTNHGLKINQIYKVNMAKYKTIKKIPTQILYIRNENTNILIEVVAGCFKLVEGVSQ